MLGAILYRIVIHTHTRTFVPSWGELSLSQAPLASASIVRVQKPENTLIVRDVISSREFYFYDFFS